MRTWFWSLVMVVALLPLTAQAVTTIEAPPLKEVIRTPTGAVSEGPPMKVPQMPRIWRCMDQPTANSWFNRLYDRAV